MKRIIILAMLVAFILTDNLQAKSKKLLSKKNMAGYVMVYHKDADHGLHMAYSWDGYTWTAFNDDKPIMAGDTIAMQKGIRDPYIFRAPDGAFCVAMTDLHVFGQRDGVRTTEWERDGKKYDWGNNRGLVLLRSFNLIHWTRTNLDLTALTCPTGEVDAEGNPLPWSEMGCAWAPEMITTEDGRIMMHFTPLGYFDDGQSPMHRTNFSEQKHGAVVQVTKKELNKLIKYWNK